MVLLTPRTVVLLQCTVVLEVVRREVPCFKIELVLTQSLVVGNMPP
jgi:hypothetical protein